MKKKPDRRVLRTRHALKEAILRLVRKKGYEAITIHEIAEAADLNRATYYLHYGSKDELLLDSLQSLFLKLIISLNALEDGELPWEIQESLTLLFEHAQEHAALYQALLIRDRLGFITQLIIDTIAREIENDCLSKPDLLRAEVPVKIAARHTAGAFYAVLTWWLEEGGNHTPHQLSEMCQRLTLEGFVQVMVRSESTLPNE